MAAWLLKKGYEPTLPEQASSCAAPIADRPSPLAAVVRGEASAETDLWLEVDCTSTAQHASDSPPRLAEERMPQVWLERRSEYVG